MILLISFPFMVAAEQKGHGFKMKRRCLRLNKRILIILKYFKYSTLNSHMHQGHLTYGKAFSILQRFPFAGLVLNRTNSGKGRLVEQVCRSSLLSG